MITVLRWLACASFGAGVGWLAVSVLLPAGSAFEGAAGVGVAFAATLAADILWRRERNASRDRLD